MAAADRLALEFISVFGQPPLEFIALAVRLECPRISFALSPIVTLPGLYPTWDLRDDRTLCRDVANALTDQGVTITMGEGLLLTPGRGAAAAERELDILAQLGTRQVNVCCLEPEFEGNVVAFAALADLAADRAMTVTAEFLPGTAIGSLDAAVRLVQATGRANAGLLIDAMHLYRSGSATAELRAIDPTLIRYAQICDVPLVSGGGRYGDEARYERGAPGNGELPLLDFVEALPPHVVIGLEAPMRRLAERGIGPARRLGPALDRTRALLDQVSAITR